MPPPPTRPTIRLPHALAAALAARVGPGATVSDVVRLALEAYLDVGPTWHRVSDADACLTLPPVSDVSDIAARLAQVEDGVAAVAQVTHTLVQEVAALADQQARRAHLARGLEVARVRPSGAACPTPPGPPFDAAKWRLGRLCDGGHVYGATGQTLRRLDNGVCPACWNALRRARRAARKRAGEGG